MSAPKASRAVRCNADGGPQCIEQLPGRLDFKNSHPPAQQQERIATAAERRKGRRT